MKVLKQLLNKKRYIVTGLVIIAIFYFWHILSGALTKKLDEAYEDQQSLAITDRNDKLIEIKPNSKGFYDQFLTEIPPRFKDLLLQKEDRHFYSHPGLNVGSIMRDAWAWASTGKRAGSSTLSQQLVKLLLAQENQRTWKNKIRELFYTESLEWRKSKNEILVMYINSAYFGNLSQGLKQASLDNFNQPAETLNDAQILSLLAGLSSPSAALPGTSQNIAAAGQLAEKFKIKIDNQDWENVKLAKTNPNIRQTANSFEAESLNLNCQINCRLTLDAGLNDNLRDILKRNLSSEALETAANGAVVVIKLPENEILGLIGSPDPASSVQGLQLNMATKPRPIGSTAKPFIYLNAFEKGARPYTLVDDSELKYQIGTGFDFFPKNFDGQYRGLVTLHQALNNSLNIPSVQTLSFVGLDNFYDYLKNELGFRPIQPLENYELGIALGGLEVDPLTLSHYFTIFPQKGWLKPLTLYRSGYNRSPYYQAPMGQMSAEPKQAGKDAAVQLVNKILNDRDTGVDQFGLKSNLNLPYKNYGVKTGTSRDYHDSWTVGFTPDFLVAVWIGNSDNKPMRQVTGLAGAAKVWHEAMQLMYNSPYNKNTPFDFSKVQELQIGDTLDYGLKNDDVEAAKNIMLKDNLITSPHDQDKFLLQENTAIPLSAAADVNWTINNKSIARSPSFSWHPTAPGTYTITAIASNGKKEQITVYINKE